MTKDVKKEMQEIADNNGAELSKFCDKIIAIKERAIDEFACPCYPDSKDHYCMSPTCKEEMLTKGRCHCGLFVKKQ